jgi:hypothetical protein
MTKTDWGVGRCCTPQNVLAGRSRTATYTWLLLVPCNVHSLLCSVVISKQITIVMHAVMSCCAINGRSSYIAAISHGVLLLAQSSCSAQKQANHVSTMHARTIPHRPALRVRAIYLPIVPYIDPFSLRQFNSRLKLEVDEDDLARVAVW